MSACSSATFCTCVHIGAFYYTIGNLHPKYRQRIGNIHLLALVKSVYVKEFGMNRILDIILEDVKKLEKVRCLYTSYIHVYNDVHVQMINIFLLIVINFGHEFIHTVGS